MTGKKFISGIIILLIFRAGLFAQDMHFSQFMMSPLYLNPAETGFFEGEFRLTGNNRNQWRSVTVPYRTFAASFDWNSMQKIVRLGNLGLGLQFMNDVAGDGNFTTTLIRFSTAWQYPFNDGFSTISVGLNVNYNQHSLDFTKLNFGSQYNGFFFDPQLPTQETYTSDNFSYADFSTGLAFLHKFNNGIPVYGGMSLNHLNRPEQTFFSDDPNLLAMKFNFYLRSDIGLKENISALPSVAVYNQGTHREILYGGLFRFETIYSTVRNIYFGGWIRHGDAGVIKIGFDYQNVNFGFSYDFNYSTLRVASHGFGGPEIGIIYIFNSPSQLPIPEKKTCPVFL